MMQNLKVGNADNIELEYAGLWGRNISQRLSALRAPLGMAMGDDCIGDVNFQ